MRKIARAPHKNGLICASPMRPYPKGKVLLNLTSAFNQPLSLWPKNTPDNASQFLPTAGSLILSGATPTNWIYWLSDHAPFPIPALTILKSKWPPSSGNPFAGKLRTTSTQLNDSFAKPIVTRGTPRAPLKSMRCNAMPAMLCLMQILQGIHTQTIAMAQIIKALYSGQCPRDGGVIRQVGS